MNKKILVLMSIGLIAASNPALAQQEQQISADENSPTFYDTYIAEKLSVGVRVGHRFLTDSDSGQEGGWEGSGTYLGTIYAIDEAPDYIPHIFASYAFTEYLSIELAYDNIKGETLATSIQHPATGTKSDGDVSLTGFTFTVMGSYPNESKFTPYAGLGFGYFQGDFEETDHWGLGYYSEPHYVDLGSPGTPYNGRRKWMDIDDTVAFLITFGTKYDLSKNFYLDASFQYIMVEADATYRKSEYEIEADHASYGTFPLDNISLRLGIGYTF